MTVLTFQQREELVEALSNRYLDSMSTRNLEEFFLERTEDLLSSYTDYELVKEAGATFDEDELNDFLGVTNETV